MPSLRAPFAVTVLAAVVVAQTPVVSWNGETMRLRSATVAAAAAGAWDVTLVMEDDNADPTLPASFRRWWHCEVAGLPPAGATLHVTVANAGYTDVILPVWALAASGAPFGSYTRVPTTATPVLQGATQHRFTLVTPPGVASIRLAKFFPYGLARKDAWLASIAGHPHVRAITTLGSSVQGRPIHCVQLTDGSVPDAGKQRVWLHSGIHPAETTSYFAVEGLCAWLLSGDPFAEVLLDHVLVDVCPMVNPDGVVAGNYRTNVASVNLENEWSAPYTSAVPEIVALRTAIEARMGTVASPGANPIRVLLNLHASHGVAHPFHFRHVANPAFHPVTSNTGVLPVVHALESQWIAAFAAHSPWVALGATQSSALVSRPFVESMCHDRWTAAPGWLGAPAQQAPVMAITFEGTYRRGPDGVTWATEADLRAVGAQLGRALCDFVGVAPAATALVYGAPCTTAALAAALAPQPDGSHAASLVLTGAAPQALGVLALGAQQLVVPLPAPWQACTLLQSADVTVAFVASGAGAASFTFNVPAVPGLTAFLQGFVLDWTAPGPLPLDASNGVRIRNEY